MVVLIPRKLGCHFFCEFFHSPFEGIVHAVDRPQRRVDLVRDTRDQIPECRHLLGLNQLRLPLLQFLVGRL